MAARIENFRNEIESIHKKWDTEGDKNHYQTYNVISTYLWLRYPDKYYIYKPTIAKEIFNELVGEQKLRSLGAEAVVKTYSLYDEISEELVKDSELRSIFEQYMTNECYPDIQMKTATVDLGYYIKNYMNPRRSIIMKTRTNITKDPEYVKKLNSLVEDTTTSPNTTDYNNIKSYWWLNANPKVWSMTEWIVGETQDYTLYNDNGNKRRIFQNFVDAKEGDVVVCYESYPTKQILGLAEVSKGSNGERLFFRKTETLTSPVDLSIIKEIPELSNMEFLVNPNGSFFRLTNSEYETIIDLIRESNKINTTVTLENYTKDDFLNEVFIDEEYYDKLLLQLKNKKNIILQGAPGVGKTFCARRLAYSMMGKKDDSRICFVQFHQSYSYEDFIMGYKPIEDKFYLKKGVFYDFCTLAKNDCKHDYFFIIDEINRGNLSKIFGELLMLIEKDYRGDKNKITLAYTGEKFYVPENLYIIGMMNTADRSLAMIDYALRRRFSFFKIKPGFNTNGFIKKMKSISEPKFKELINLIKELNEKIIKDDSLGEGFEIGHSYFCFNENDNIKDVLNGIIEFDIAPMLEEYWFDNKTKVNEWSQKLKAILND